MSKIVFFSIPAYGHTNPTLAVVEHLVRGGHAVWYYSFEMFREKIEAAGAEFIACDKFLAAIPGGEQKRLDKKVGKDFAALIEMTTEMTIRMEEKVCGELARLAPDCIVADSMCIWGKLYARKMGIRLVCSTTTFAMNEHTARLMRPGVGEMVRMLMGQGRINRKLKELRAHGYPVNGLISLIQNDNDTDTICYTSKLFQPMAETFSKRYCFVGPSIPEEYGQMGCEAKERSLYISLGTILNCNNSFYKKCFQAFGGSEYQVIVSVGEQTNLASLGEIPPNFVVKNQVNQLAVLQKAAVFLTHCGMNSASESLYYGVPMVLYPQHSEEAMVAQRVEELGAGVRLKSDSPAALRRAVEEVFSSAQYKEEAGRIRESFLSAGGAKCGADYLSDICATEYRQ